MELMFWIGIFSVALILFIFINKLFKIRYRGFGSMALLYGFCCIITFIVAFELIIKK